MKRKDNHVKRKRGSSIKRSEELKKLISREIENNRTIFEILDRH